MKKINLRDVYPFYENDCFVMVDDEIAEIFEESKRKELNYQRKVYWNKAHYSLDRDDGIEHEAIFVSMSPYEIYERKMTNQELHCAISKLPDIQAKRIYAYYFLDMNKSEIARAEDVSVKEPEAGNATGTTSLADSCTPMISDRAGSNSIRVVAEPLETIRPVRDAAMSMRL